MGQANSRCDKYRVMRAICDYSEQLYRRVYACQLQARTGAWCQEFDQVLCLSQGCHYMRMTANYLRDVHYHSQARAGHWS